MTSIAAKHAKGKSAQDKIFGANAAAVAAAAMPMIMECSSRQLQNPTPQTKPKKKQSLLMNLNTTELIFIRTMNFIPMKRKRVTENCLPQSLQNM